MWNVTLISIFLLMYDALVIESMCALLLSMVNYSYSLDKGC